MVAEGKAKAVLTFQVYRGDQLVDTRELSQDVIKIGALESSHLRIDDEKVSRMHAVIEAPSAEDVSIVDIGSQSGTLVNGQKVNKSPLKSGDVIQVGDTTIAVTVRARSIAPSAPAGVMPAAAAAAVSAPPPLMPSPTMLGSLPPEDPEQVTYRMVASGPAVSADEVESSEQAVEVVIMWGNRSVLHVEHMSPPRSFYVGDASDAKGKPAVDYLIGSEVLGTDRLPVVVEVGGGAGVVIPQGATGSVMVGNQSMSFADLVAGGKTQAYSEPAGAQVYPLPRDATARVQYRGFTFLVKPTAAGRKVGTGFRVEPRPFIFIGGTMAFFAALLIMFYFLPPRGSALNLDLLNADSRLVDYLMEPPELEEEEEPEWLQDNADDQEGGQGKRHKDEEGQMGKQEAPKTKNKYAIEGPQDNPDPHMAREEAKEQARNAGILGTLANLTGSFNAPTSPYGRDTALGTDPTSALGALMGDQIGENFGFGGLGLRGTGRGGGGTGEGTIGLGNFGTIGHGGGRGTGSGYGSGAGGLGGRAAKVPQIRGGNADVRGSLSAEVIRRVVRRHMNEVRFCYEQELNQRPDLEGRVAVGFIISPTGSVQSATVNESTLQNQRVEGCITTAVRRWGFPAPDGGGIVVVTYPFLLSPAGT